MKLAIIDNYDSFTYNLVHYAEPFCDQLDVFFNDQLDFKQMEAYDKIIISPGPGLPSDSGDLMKLIERFHNQKPILGVCLGHQALAVYFGATLFNMQQVIHGKEKLCEIVGEASIFHGLPKHFQVGRYHSWAVDHGSLPKVLNVTAVDEGGIIMGLKHVELPIETVQFHPESIMTEHGKRMIENWIKS